MNYVCDKCNGFGYIEVESIHANMLTKEGKIKTSVLKHKITCSRCNGTEN